MEKNSINANLIARTLKNKINKNISSSMFGTGSTLGTYYGDTLKLDNFNIPLNDFMVSEYLLSDDLGKVIIDDTTITIDNKFKLKSGDRVLVQEMGADVVIVAKIVK